MVTTTDVVTTISSLPNRGIHQHLVISYTMHCCNDIIVHYSYLCIIATAFEVDHMKKKKENVKMSLEGRFTCVDFHSP